MVIDPKLAQRWVILQKQATKKEKFRLLFARSPPKALVITYLICCLSQATIIVVSDKISQHSVGSSRLLRLDVCFLRGNQRVPHSTMHSTAPIGLAVQQSRASSAGVPLLRGVGNSSFHAISLLNTILLLAVVAGH